MSDQGLSDYVVKPPISDIRAEGGKLLLSRQNSPVEEVEFPRFGQSVIAAFGNTAMPANGDVWLGNVAMPDNELLTLIDDTPGVLEFKEDGFFGVEGRQQWIRSGGGAATPTSIIAAYVEERSPGQALGGVWGGSNVPNLAVPNTFSGDNVIVPFPLTVLRVLAGTKWMFIASSSDVDTTFTVNGYLRVIRFGD